MYNQTVDFNTKPSKEMKMELNVKTKANRESGFTLVELAIVMIIIGLLIGGVLKGQQLIENAKVTATISQVKGFQAALNSFRDTYSATPGDMANATARLAGCTAANNCANGGGNGLITSGATGENPTWNAVTIASGGAETVQAWKHLALADLITGVQINADGTTTAGRAWGASNPASSLRGGYEIYYDSNNTDFSASSPSGHMLRLSNGGVSGSNIDVAGTAPASPLQAANIDRKLDDGRPTTGSVLSNGTTCFGTVSGTTESYLEQTAQKNCNLFFLIDG